MLKSHIKSVIVLFCLLSTFLFMTALGADEKNKITLAGFDVDKKEVQSPDIVNFNAHIISPNGLLKENKSNISITHAQYIEPRSLMNPFNTEKRSIFFGTSRVFGNDTDGTFSGNMKIDANAQEGVWHFQSVDIVDAKGISQQYEGKDLDAFKADFEVQVGGGRWISMLVLIPLIFFIFIYVLYTRGKEGWHIFKNIKNIYTGKDGASSTSKAQFLLWTIVVLYAYIITVLDGFFNHGWLDLTPKVPDNLLIVMGLASLTALGAKTITSDYVNKGLIFSLDTSKGGLFLDDNGNPSLAKIQLAAWNLVAFGVFLAKVLNGIISSTTLTTGLPDIDTTLMYLIGIGDLSYLGKKYADKEDPNAPKLSDIDPKKGDKTTLITIKGSNLGKVTDGHVVIGDKEWKKTNTYSVNLTKDTQCSWKENEIKFKLNCLDPAADLIGDMKIGLQIGEKDSVNQLDFTLN